MKKNYGILSTASIVPRFVNAVRASGDGTVLAIASRSADKAREKADALGIERAYGSYQALMDDKDVNIVYIATINSEHYANCLMALEHGKHVICEKPFVLKKQEAEHLFALAAERGLFIMEAQKVVFLPVMEAIKNILQSGHLGQVRLVDMTSSCEATYNNWLGLPEAGGGCLYGNASYTIQMLTCLFDEMPEYIAGAAIRSPSGTDAQCVINLTTQAGVLIVSKISQQVNAINKAFIYGEKGYIEIADYWKARKATVHYASGDKEELNFPCDHELVYEVRHIHDCLNKHAITSPVMSPEMTINTISMLELIHQRWAEQEQ
ncbi:MULTISPECIES: Gfo/Idh/MocA family protein [Erwinia]|uniref:Oxidoreductase n=1 Tax=Erwinia rhapontici TaxID=55212 RepID=A0ABN6DLR4_ERWRD|nr:Gfo/Idh/MocA family oxidoreductase [Erwinia rhapontici]TDT02037.1 putative dehydrogenase [Erwinia rhapontici]BCQ35621.1 oxidoreductase [Erwinia rhapontici]BCQ40523.1 oxidoreductase [Erwinia rhapontici]BCQ45803.1 oxidoreductase [Erwinia rhapontici]